MKNKVFPRVKLGHFCVKIGSGATPRGGSKVYLEKGNVALIRSQNVFNDGFSRGGLVYITDDHAQQLSSAEVEPGDILLNITGDSVARCCQVPTDVLPARVNQHVAIIRPMPDEFDPRFLRYFLISPEMQSRMLAWAHAGATRKALTKEMIESFEVVKPDLSTQKRIASVLGSLDDKIALNRRIILTSEQLAMTLFRSWFIDFNPVTFQDQASSNRREADLFPTSFQDSTLGPIPKGWKVRYLTDIVEINPKRKLAKGSVAPYLEMSDLPTVGPSPESWSFREVGSGSKFTNGDTLLARITPCLENGKTAFVDFLQEGEVAWGSTEYIVLRPKGAIPPFFAYLLARTPSFRNFAIGQMTGSSGRQRVPAESLAKFEIVCPDPDSPVFKVFGDMVKPYVDRIRVAAKQNRSLLRIRDTLLPRLMSGEIELPDTIATS